VGDSEDRAGYDQYPLHKNYNERLLDALRDIMDGADVDAGQTAEILTAALEAWFIDHFRIHDARLHKRLGSHEH
jgi:hemerythrin